MRLDEDASEGFFFGVRGPKSSSDLEPMDCYKLVRVARDIEMRSLESKVRLDLSMRVLKEESGFVPPEVFDVLVCAFEDCQQLARVFKLDWVRTWAWWGEIKKTLARCDDAALKKCMWRCCYGIFECVYARGGS